MSEAAYEENEQIISPQEEIEVIAVDDTPEEDRRPVRENVEPFNIDEEIQTQDETVRKRINRLKYEYHQQRREKEAAERLKEEAIAFAKKAQDENTRLQGLVGQSEQALLQSVQTRTQAELESAREKYKKAHEDGDTDGMVAAQEQLARVQADRAYIDNYQPQMQQPSTEQQAPESVEQPSQQPLDPRLQTWLANNTWFGAPGNEAVTGFAYGLDEMLAKRGVERNSPQYFEAIDQALRKSFPKAFGVEEQQQAEDTSSKPNTVVASAQRTSGGKRQVKLNSSQIALCKRLGITPEQYARQQMGN